MTYKSTASEDYLKECGLGTPETKEVYLTKRGNECDPVQEGVAVERNVGCGKVVKKDGVMKDRTGEIGKW